MTSTIATFPQVFQSLQTKFLPEDQACNDFNKALQIIQTAYWTYCDKLCKRFNYLPKLSWYEFAYLSVKIAYSNSLGLHFNTYFKQFDFYLKESPVCGCVCIDPSNKYVLLVKGLKWSFPKGKLQDYETPEQCAERECFEEIGLRVKVDPNLKIHIQFPKPITFYIIKNVNPSSQLQLCPYEINQASWVPIDKLYQFKVMGGKAVYFYLKSLLL